MLLRFGFAQLQLRRISATCHPDNHASSRVLEKAGLVFGGRMRSHLLVRGAWRDPCCMPPSPTTRRCARCLASRETRVITSCLVRGLGLQGVSYALPWIRGFGGISWAIGCSG